MGNPDNIDRLIEVMARLRNPDSGCPWDKEQNFSTIAPYTIEEAYEVADAIQRNDMSALQEELGDLLLQVVYHARMAEEIDAFDFDAVAETISDKMIRRHPHVFGEIRVASAEVQTLAWEADRILFFGCFHIRVRIRVASKGACRGRGSAYRK